MTKVRKFFFALALSAVMMSVGLAGAFAARNHVSVKLRPPVMHSHMMMMVEHAYGNAKISYTKRDADINLTADKLPKPGTIHENAYVLWLVNGSSKVNVGSLSVHGNMAGLHKTTMNVKFNKLVVTAEKSLTVSHPMGPKVLAGDVLRH
jgi:hypothetical protein